MKTRKLKLQTKTLIKIILLVLIIMVIWGVGTYQKVSNYMIDQCKNQAMDTAQSAALAIDRMQLSQVKEGDEESENYLNLVQKLRCYLNDNGLEYIYIMRKDADGTIRFWVDADEEDPEVIGGVYEIYDELEEAFAGVQSVDEEPTTDEWGSYYTAYAPIMTEDGKVLAVLGVDYSMAKIDACFSNLMKFMTVIALISLVVAVVVAMWICMGLGHNLKSVNKKVDELAHSDGDLTKKIEVHSGDELEVIANNINDFVQGLQKMMIDIRTQSFKVGDVGCEIDKTIQKLLQQFEGIGRVAVDIAREMEVQKQVVVTSNDRVEAVLENIQLIMEDSKDIYVHVDEVNQVIDNSEDTMDALRDIINKGHENSEEVAQVNAHLLKQIDTIRNITDTIVEISQQTKMLAFNASIEAARAGEAGKGFAVVSTSIGELSGKTDEAVLLIQKRINEIIVLTKEVISSSEQNVSIMKEQEEQTAHIQQMLKLLKERFTVIQEKIVHTQEQENVMISANANLEENMEQLQSVVQGLIAISEELLMLKENQSSSIAHVSTQILELDQSGKGLQKEIGKFVVD